MSGPDTHPSGGTAADGLVGLMWRLWNMWLAATGQLDARAFNNLAAMQRATNASLQVSRNREDRAEGDLWLLVLKHHEVTELDREAWLALALLMDEPGLKDMKEPAALIHYDSDLGKMSYQWDLETPGEKIDLWRKTGIVAGAYGEVVHVMTRTPNSEEVH